MNNTATLKLRIRDSDVIKDNNMISAPVFSEIH